MTARGALAQAAIRPLPSEAELTLTTKAAVTRDIEFGGAEGIRTPDLCRARVRVRIRIRDGLRVPV